MRLLFEYLPGMDIAMLGGTFARATTATYIDKNGRLQTAASGALRDNHWIDGVRHTLIEPSRTQICPNPQTPASWSDFGTPVLTTGQPDPWGGNAALLIEDTDAVNNVGKQVGVTYTGDGTKIVTVAVRRGTGSAVRARIWDSTAAAVRHDVAITWSNGSIAPTVVTSSGAGTIFPSTPVFDANGVLWWLVNFSADGVVAANANRIEVFSGPIGTALGTFYFAGANTANDDYPATWQPTQNHLRNTDHLTFAIAFNPRVLTAFADFIDLGNNLVAVVSAHTPRILGIGDVNGPRFLLFKRAGQRYHSYHQNIAGASSVEGDTAVDVTVVKTRVKLRGVLNEDGSTQAGIAINGAAEQTAAASPASTLQPRWNTNVLSIGNDVGGTQVAASAFRAVRVLAGVHSFQSISAPLSYIRFEDGDGVAYLSNEKPFPANRFQSWTPDPTPFGDSANTLATGAKVMLRLRDDFSASFELPMIPSVETNDVVPTQLAARLMYHLRNGGTCMVVTGDAEPTVYSTCGLKPGSTPQLALSNRQTMEYALSLALLNLATTPDHMHPPRYADQ